MSDRREGKGHHPWSAWPRAPEGATEWDSKRGPGHAEPGLGGSVGSFMMVSVCSSMDLWGFFGLYLASQMELELQVEKAALGGGW